MARYRRGWNGLTELTPEPVFHPEVMDLQVFAVPKRPRIVTEPMPRKKSRKNAVLWTITISALTGLIIAGCAQRMTTAVWIAAAACMAWITIFLTANRRVL